MRLSRRISGSQRRRRCLPVRRAGGTGSHFSVSKYRLCLVRDSAGSYDRPISCSAPEAAAALAWEILEGMEREAIGAILLDSRNRAVGHLIAYLGCLSRTFAEPRGLLVPALLANAAGLVLFHNHPSGDPTPSAEDVVFTRRLREAGQILGVEVFDHLVLGEQPAFTSFRRDNAW